MCLLLRPSPSLRAGQREPEKYRHLTVRVAGYSAHFVSLSRELQDHIIARAEREGAARASRREGGK